MALTDENGGTPFTMPVQPMYGNNGGGGFVAAAGAWAASEVDSEQTAFIPG